MDNASNHYNPEATLFAISDATGQTVRRVLLAALAQFPDANVQLQIIGRVRTAEQIEAAVEEAAKVDATIVYTLVKDDLRQHMYKYGQRHNIYTIDLLESLLMHLQDVLGRAPSGQLGMLTRESFKRSAAMSFTVKHDDGQRPQDLPQADIVLVGVSRTSKTPISVYLSYHGWRVANIPITLHASLPSELSEVDRRKVIGLTIEASRLRKLRQARVQHLGVRLPDYTNLSAIRKELAHAFELYHENGWHIVDVTDRSVEEAGTEIIHLVEQQPPFTL